MKMDGVKKPMKSNMVQLIFSQAWMELTGYEESNVKFLKENSKDIDFKD